MSIFLSPHSDDETLFGSFIIQRTKPLVIICTDGTSHARKFGIPIEQRREESKQAARIMGVEVRFLGIAEEDLTFRRLCDAVRKECNEILIDFLFAPQEEGGSWQHDIVANVGEDFSDHTIYYSTYTKQSFIPHGSIAIIPTEAEKKIKDRALACYTSQLAINKHHFDAVKNVPEYLSFRP